MRKKIKADVAIVGGGMVGATLACALLRGGVRVALVESHLPQRQWESSSVDLRVSALTEGSKNILNALGVWSGMVDMGVSPYRYMGVWDPRFGGELYFDAADAGRDYLGHIVENRVTVAALWSVIEKLKGVRVLCPSRVVDLSPSYSGYSLSLDDDCVIEPDLIVAADGSNSLIRSMSGMMVKGWSYGQHGLVTVVQTEDPHNETAYQRFLQEGPLAFLPLRDGRCSIVWTLSSETAKKTLTLSDSEFLVVLNEASGGILGQIQSAGKRVSFPLALHYTTSYSDKNLVLIGDAAHAVHPLAGQGANMGMLDAAALAQVVMQARQEGRALSSRMVLRRYERWRKGDNLAMLWGLDLLKRTFTGGMTPIGMVRSAGMNAVNSMQPIKNYLNSYAMGLREDLPQLAYGESCWPEV